MVMYGWWAGFIFLDPGVTKRLRHLLMKGQNGGTTDLYTKGKHNS